MAGRGLTLGIKDGMQAVPAVRLGLLVKSALDDRYRESGTPPSVAPPGALRLDYRRHSRNCGTSAWENPC